MWANFMGDPYDCFKEWVNLSPNEKWKAQVVRGMVWLFKLPRKMVNSCCWPKLPWAMGHRYGHSWQLGPRPTIPLGN